MILCINHCYTASLLAGVAGVVGGILFLLVLVTIILFVITLKIRRNIPKATFKPHYTVERVGARHTSSITHTDIDSLEDIPPKETKDDESIAVTFQPHCTVQRVGAHHTSSITHTDIDKLKLYAAMNVPEFWRYNGEVWRIYVLCDREYQEVEVSPTFPQVLRGKLYEFLAMARQDEVDAELAFSQL